MPPVPKRKQTIDKSILKFVEDAPRHDGLTVVACDCEATGVDIQFGAMPYIVTMCRMDVDLKKPAHHLLWEWDVNPLTREVEIPKEDVYAIQYVLDAFDIIAGQNFKFDAAALLKIGVTTPWPKLRDTIMGGHLLASNHRHNLTDMCVEHLGYDIEPFEKRVKQCTVQCRNIIKKEFPDWRLAKEGLPDMPSVNDGNKRDEDKAWKADMWVCRALALHYDALGYGIEHPEWLTVTSEYANTDTATTLPLWLFMEQEIKRRGLWEIFIERMHLPRLAYQMEQKCVTTNGKTTEQVIEEFSLEIAMAEDDLTIIANDYGHDLKLAEGAATNDNMREFLYGKCREVCVRCGFDRCVKEWENDKPLGYCKKCDDPKKKEKNRVKAMTTVDRNPCLSLPKLYNAKSKGPSLDKDVMFTYMTTLDGKPLEFIKTLTAKRNRDTAVGYATSYKKFWIPTEYEDWYRMSCTFNPVGTDHLRWSSYNPNATNVSKREDFTLRILFGPMPRREWWSMDGQNLELRIPAYESGEEAMVELFERPNDAPYFGSYHCLVASIVYPQQFNEVVCLKCLGTGCHATDGKQVPCTLRSKWVPLSTIKDGFKKRYKATLYQWTKNGNFAMQYGCGERKADATFRVKGAFRMLREKLPKIAALSQKYMNLANKIGYIETIPDKTINPKRGYPILASRTDDGRVSPTTPFNYHISGTAMQWTNKCMYRTDDQIQQWNRQGWDGFMTLQIHDEIVFDMPAGVGPEPWLTNHGKAMQLRDLMVSCGDTIGVPTPVSVEYHSETWATGLAM